MMKKEEVISEIDEMIEAKRQLIDLFFCERYPRVKKVENDPANINPELEFWRGYEAALIQLKIELERK